VAVLDRLCAAAYQELMVDKPTTSDLAFEEILARLEAIAKQLENGDAKLEEALALFEEGVGLAKVGTQRLDDAERKIEILRDDNKVEAFAAEVAGES